MGRMWSSQARAALPSKDPKPKQTQDQSTEFLTNARAWGCAVCCETSEETPCYAVLWFPPPIRSSLAFYLLCVSVKNTFHYILSQRIFFGVPSSNSLTGSIYKDRNHFTFAHGTSQSLFLCKVA